ncbi:acyltransferase family protein [Microbacterium sp. NPDC019599]|uniref:acyltransferase family protein n=1 Tax=Microbacterium sp. NPDC019599 TaxID=3154690 RepID=UPI003408E2E2
MTTTAVRPGGEAAPASTPARERSGSALRTEIQALRAIAVLGVIIFHLWPNRMTGGYIGVDVFFVISGYLITSHLFREVEARGRIKVSQFYARRIRRLLPAAMLVLASTALAVVAFVPAQRIPAFLYEVAASALYVENWVLAANSVDYFAADGPESPVQHYWSLSVEEQFYLVWPLLVILLALLAAARNWSPRASIFVGLTGVFAASLAFSAFATAASPQAAYFSTLTHAWEFAAGGMLALASPWIARTAWDRMPGARAGALWAGIVIVIGTMFVFDAHTAVPGLIALVPVAGTIAVIAAGTSPVPWSPSRLLSIRPVQFVGDTSYAAYLWHWPIIVLLPYVLTRPLSTLDKILILLATFGLAWLTRALIERPVINGGFWRRRRISYGFAVLSAAIVLALCVVPSVAIANESAATQQRVTASLGQTESCVGAEAMTHLADCAYGLELDPDLAVSAVDYETLASDVVTSAGGEADCSDGAYESRICTYSPPHDSGGPTVVLVGDSHAEHLLPALAHQATIRDWNVRVVTKRSCPFVEADWRATGGAAYKQNDADCVAWRADIVDQVASDDQIDLVLTTTYAHRVGMNADAAAQAEFSDALARTWTALDDAGKPVVVVADTPVAKGNRMSECLADAPSPLECSLSRAEALPPDPLAASVAEASGGTTLLDLTGAFCDAERCFAAIGGMPVYQDSHHLTPAFSLSLSSRFTAAIEAAIAR